MSYPNGYNELPAIEDIELHSAQGCIDYIVANRVKFRYEGEKNTMAWWDAKGNQGKELSSLVMLVRGIVESYDDAKEVAQ